MSETTEYYPTNVLRGKTPIFEDWTEDPTDAENLTDGDLSTAMTTGSKTTTAAYQYAYCHYDVPAGLYQMGGLGHATSVDGAGYIYLFVDGIRFASSSVSETKQWFRAMFAAVESEISVAITATSAATVTPHIYEFYAVRLGDL